MMRDQGSTSQIYHKLKHLALVSLLGFSAESDLILNIQSPAPEMRYPAPQPRDLHESRYPMSHFCFPTLPFKSKLSLDGPANTAYLTSHSTLGLDLLFLSMVLTTSQGIQAGYLGAMLGSVLSLVAYRKGYCFSILHLVHSHFLFSTYGHNHISSGSGHFLLGLLTNLTTSSFSTRQSD